MTDSVPKFWEQAKQLDQAVKKLHGPKASYNWRPLWYKALKYATPEQVKAMSIADAIEFVGQHEKRDAELAAMRANLQGAVPSPVQPDRGTGAVLPIGARLLKWRKTWEIIKPEVVQNHKTAYEIAGMIKNNQLLEDKLRDCPQSGDTLNKIIKAGLAGQLD